MTAPALTFPAAFSIISDEISQDLADVRRFVRRFGFSGFELRSMFGRAFKDLTPSDVAAVKAAAREEGWRIHGCATPVFKCPIDDDAAIREHIEIFKRSLDVARTLESDLLRVFTFLRRPMALDAATLARIVEQLERLAAIAAGSGVRLGVENESSCIIGSGAETLRLTAACPAEKCGIIWDPCNVLYVPEAAERGEEMFERLAPRVIHIHVKDALRRSRDGQRSPEPVPVGLGDVGWRAQLAAIRRSGYRGLLSLETHWRVVQIEEKLLHLPAGHAFSRGGEEASNVCAYTLQNLWETQD